MPTLAEFIEWYEKETIRVEVVNSIFQCEHVDILKFMYVFKYHIQ